MNIFSMRSPTNINVYNIHNLFGMQSLPIINEEKKKKMIDKQNSDKKKKKKDKFKKTLTTTTTEATTTKLSSFQTNYSPVLKHIL